MLKQAALLLKATLTAYRPQGAFSVHNPDGTLRLVYCKSGDLVDGALTKPLTGPEVNRFHGAFSGMRPTPHPAFASSYGRIGSSLHNPDLFPLLSDV